MGLLRKDFHAGEGEENHNSTVLWYLCRMKGKNKTLGVKSYECRGTMAAAPHTPVAAHDLLRQPS